MATSNLPEEAAAVEPDDNDSTYEEDSASSTASLRSSLLESVREFGRGYHRYKAGQYPVPDDEVEAERLDLQHHLWLKTLDGKLFLAPLDKNKLHNVLDMGTGTGIWAIDFAEEHPSAEVIGVDLSPCQPALVPPNCKFEIDDCEEPWTFKQKFDYVHGRVLIAAFQNWPRVFKQVYNALSPGGWFEMHDLLYPPTSDDGTLKEGSAFYKWGQLMVKGTENAGREIAVASRYKQWMIDAGFTDVTEIRMMWPQNQWPDDPKQKDLGLWTMVTVLEGLQGFSMAVMTKGLGMSTEEVNLLLMDVRKEIKDKSIHSYWPIYLVYGQKPEHEA